MSCACAFDAAGSLDRSCKGGRRRGALALTSSTRIGSCGSRSTVNGIARGNPAMGCPSHAGCGRVDGAQSTKGSRRTADGRVDDLIVWDQCRSSGRECRSQSRRRGGSNESGPCACAYARDINPSSQRGRSLSTRFKRQDARTDRGSRERHAEKRPRLMPGPRRLLGFFVRQIRSSRPPS